MNGEQPGREAVVAVRDLTKRYGRVTAIRGVGFEVGRGEALALWGPNGAGKTTILRCLLGLARYEGEVRLDGTDPARDGREAHRRIGYVPQQLPVPAMTVGELAAYIAGLKKVPAAAVAGPLEQLGLREVVDRPVAALSGGMRQRLGVALALVGSPSVLLLDEPTASLDARGRSDLLRLFWQLKRDGMVMVFSSHRQDDVLALADRVLLLEQGEVQAEVTPDAYLAAAGLPTRLVLTLSNGHRAEALGTLERLGLPAEAHGAVVRVAVEPGRKAELIAALTGAGIGIDDIDVERATWTDLS